MSGSPGKARFVKIYRKEASSERRRQGRSLQKEARLRESRSVSENSRNQSSTRLTRRKSLQSLREKGGIWRASSENEFTRFSEKTCLQK